MTETLPPRQNTRARIGTNDDTRDDVVELYAIDRDGAEVIRTRFVRDATTRTLHVYRDEWAWVWPHRNARRGVDIDGHYRHDGRTHVTYDLAGTDGQVVEHDGRDWSDYARERFAVLMSKRFPHDGGR